MNSTSSRKTPRRRFLRSAVGAAILTTLPTAKFTAKAAPPNPLTLKKKRQNALSKKLGPLEDHPSSTTEFKKLNKRRMPGWRADTAETGKPKDAYYFEEEAIGQDNTGGSYVYRRFPPPNLFPEPLPGENPTPFEEPTSSTDYAGWQKFNKWILGGSLDANSTTPFDVLLNEIAKRVRRYNAALYWLRRLHFAENAPSGSIKSPRNPNGDKDDNGTYDPAPGTATFKQKVSDAEDEWMNAVDSLNNILSGDEVPSPNPMLPYIAADMIEVNGYIVSMRIIAQKDDFVTTKGNYSFLEVVGSSSSHISISSAFRYP